MSKTKITVNSNGSLKVEGDIEVVDKNGAVYNLQGRTIISLPLWPFKEQTIL